MIRCWSASSLLVCGVRALRRRRRSSDNDLVALRGSPALSQPHAVQLWTVLLLRMLLVKPYVQVRKGVGQQDA
jgi:hypothetical protein